MFWNYFCCSFISSFVIITALFKLGHSSDVRCFGLLTNESTIKSLDEFTSCMNSSLYLIQNATFCLPIQKNGRVDMFVDWYSHVTYNIGAFTSSTNRESLLFGMWSFSGFKDDENFVYDSSAFRFFSPGLPIILAKATLKFVQYIKWERVAVITDVSSYFYLNIAEQIYNTFIPDINVHYFQLLDSEKAIDWTLNRLQNLKLRIVIVSLPLDSLKKLMCKRLALNMVWPDYAWLALGVDYQMLVKQPCLDQTLLFQQRIQDASHQSSKKVNFNYDELIEISTSASKISTNCHHIHQSTYEVDIYQLDKELIYISNYSMTDGLTSFILSPVPTDLPLQSSLTGYIVFSFLYLPVFIFLTLTLIMYFHFRNEPEVKATGVSLSILTFIGCYLLLTYLAALNLNLLPNYYRVSLTFRNFMCQLLLWFNGLSVPTALILSVLLVKLVRVYCLFTYHKTMKKWECQDITLAMYALLLTSPLIIICTVQSAINKYVSTITRYSRDDQFDAFLVCKGDHEFDWLFGQLAYMLVLSILLIIMAIKTRKIQLEDFKDTKKVIALMIAVIMTSCLGVVYLFIFQAIESNRLFSSTLLMLTHCSFILECLVFLFLPKLYPILKKRLL